MTSFSTPFSPRAFTCRHYFLLKQLLLRTKRRKIIVRRIFLPLHRDGIHHLDRIGRTVQSYGCEPSASPSSCYYIYFSPTSTPSPKWITAMTVATMYTHWKVNILLHYILSPMCFEIGIERFVVRVLYCLLGSTLYLLPSYYCLQLCNPLYKSILNSFLPLFSFHPCSHVLCCHC